MPKISVFFALYSSFLSSFLPVGKQSQLLLQQTEVELGLQVGVEFDNEELLENNVKQ